MDAKKYISNPCGYQNNFEGKNLIVADRGTQNLIMITILKLVILPTKWIRLVS